MYFNTPVVNWPLSHVSAPNFIGPSQFGTAADTGEDSISELINNKLKAIHWRTADPIYRYYFGIISEFSRAYFYTQSLLLVINLFAYSASNSHYNLV